MQLDAIIAFNTNDRDSLEAAASTLTILLKQVNEALNKKSDPGKYWMTKDPKPNSDKLVPILYKDMEDRHLANALHCLVRKDWVENSPHLKPLLKEASARWGDQIVSYDEAQEAGLCRSGIRRFLKYHLGNEEVKEVSVGYLLERVEYKPLAISELIKHKFGGS